MRILGLILFCCLLQDFAIANNGWIPYNGYVHPPTVEVPPVPEITYTTELTIRPVLTYVWIPVYVNKPIIINNYGIFCRRQQIIYQPTIEWIYQPIWR